MPAVSNRSLAAKGFTCPKACNEIIGNKHRRKFKDRWNGQFKGKNQGTDKNQQSHRHKRQSQFLGQCEIGGIEIIGYSPGKPESKRIENVQADIFRTVKKIID